MKITNIALNNATDITINIMNSEILWTERKIVVFAILCIDPLVWFRLVCLIFHRSKESYIFNFSSLSICYISEAWSFLQMSQERSQTRKIPDSRHLLSTLPVHGLWNIKLVSYLWSFDLHTVGITIVSRTSQACTQRGDLLERFQVHTIWSKGVRSTYWHVTPVKGSEKSRFKGSIILPNGTTPVTLPNRCGLRRFGRFLFHRITGLGIHHCI